MGPLRFGDCRTPDTLRNRPFFFHCLSCIAAVHRGAPPPKPDDRRDKGICIRCGEPAEHLRDRRFTPSAACQQAEAKGITVARLSTRKWCADCDPNSLPFCQSRACPDKRKRHRAAACIAKRHHVPHCAVTCARAKRLHAQGQRRRSHRLRAPAVAQDAVAGNPISGAAGGAVAQDAVAVNPASASGQVMHDEDTLAVNPASGHTSGESRQRVELVTCEWCGASARGWRPKKRFCNYRCRNAARYAAKKAKAA